MAMDIRQTQPAWERDSEGPVDPEHVRELQDVPREVLMNFPVDIDTVLHDKTVIRPGALDQLRAERDGQRERLREWQREVAERPGPLRVAHLQAELATRYAESAQALARAQRALSEWARHILQEGAGRSSLNLELDHSLEVHSPTGQPVDVTISIHIDAAPRKDTSKGDR